MVHVLQLLPFGLTVGDRRPAAAPPMSVTRWALLADSSSGSTWMNHVLASHPCAVSQGEYLMGNATAASVFHSGLAGIATVLDDISAKNGRLLEARRPHCPVVAGGVKLKLHDRDVTFGSDGNALLVSEALRQRGYHVLLLQRGNHLDSVLGRLSRRRTGVLHCRRANATSTGGRFSTGCDPARMTLSMTLHCKRVMHTIDVLRLRARASEGLLFRGWPRQGRWLRVEYEELVRSPSLWLEVLRLLQLPTASACNLRDAHQKRVQQSQRHLIRNWDTFSACLRRGGSAYERLLHPDQRPASGILPRDDGQLCAGGATASLAGTGPPQATAQLTEKI